MLLSELCKRLNGLGLSATIEGDDCDITAVATLEEAQAGEISFLANRKYEHLLESTRASAVLVKPKVEVAPSVAAVRTPDPYAAMAASIVTIHGYRRHPQWGVSDKAEIDPSAAIGAGANIGPFVTIAAGASIGARCTIYPGCYVAEGASIGDDSTLFPNVVVYDGCVVGNRCTIHAGTVIGEDGLGYAPFEGKWLKIPQVGVARLGDDVEIGANCAVDRATLGETVIGSGTKFSNQVAIGHGCRIGEHCMFVGQVGLAGSTTVGNHVSLAGQVGAAGHLTIGDGAQVGAQAGIAGDLPGGKTYLGSPAIPIDEMRRSFAAVRKLPQWVERIRELERSVAKLQAQLKAETNG